MHRPTLRPTHRLPFAFGMEEASRRARKWIAQRNSGAALEGLRPRYVPFFLFDVAAEAVYRGKGSAPSLVPRLLRGWREPAAAGPTSGTLRLALAALHVPAVLDLPNPAVAALPFGAFEALVPIDADPALDADAQRVTRSLDDARQSAETELLSRLEQAALAALGGAEGHLDELIPHCVVENARLALLPVYLGRAKVAGREHAFALDGFGGACASDLLPARRRGWRTPLRWLAIAGAIALAALELTIVRGLELAELGAIGAVLTSLVLSFGVFLVLHERLVWPLLALALVGLVGLELTLLFLLGVAPGVLFATGAVLAVLLALLLVASFPTRESREKAVSRGGRRSKG